jgi:hypothetical protein
MDGKDSLTFRTGIRQIEHLYRNFDISDFVKPAPENVRLAAIKKLLQIWVASRIGNPYYDLC